MVRMVKVYLLFTVLLLAHLLGNSVVLSAQTTEMVLMMPAAPPTNPHIIDEIIASFEKKYPDIKVKHEVGDNVTKLVTMVAAGLAPDLATINGIDAPKFYRDGFALDLTSYIKRDGFDTSILPPLHVSLTWDGRWYGMPQAGSAFADRAIFYNRDMFNKAGIPFPTTEWTWSKFDEIARKLTQDTAGSGQINQWGYTFTNLEWPIYVWSGGGDIFNATHTEFTLNRPAATNALNWWASLTNAGVARTAPVMDFSKGAVAMSTAAYFQAQTTVDANVMFDWSIVEFPRGSNGAVNTTTIHPFLIPVGAKHPDAAWKFLQHWLSDEVQRRLVLEWRWRPAQTRTIARELARLRLDKAPYTYAPFMGQTGSARALPMDVPNWTAIQGVINNAILDIWKGTKSAENAMEAIAAQVKALM